VGGIDSLEGQARKKQRVKICSSDLRKQSNAKQTRTGGGGECVCCMDGGKHGHLVQANVDTDTACDWGFATGSLSEGVLACPNGCGAGVRVPARDAVGIWG
jgi:hypothetical protein